MKYTTNTDFVSIKEIRKKLLHLIHFDFDSNAEIKALL